MTDDPLHGSPYRFGDPLTNGRALHVWLRREVRRHGLLRGVWPQWRECYGEDFRVAAPNLAMQEYLRHV